MILKSNLHTHKAPKDNVKIIAHRGFSAIAPENTLSAIQKALDCRKADYIEIDVHLSKDGVPVVIHDATLGRTGLDPYNRLVHELDWKQLQNRDVGSWFGSTFQNEPLPSLEQVLALMQKHPSIPLMIELKEGPAEMMAAAVLNLLAPISRPQHLIGSFDPSLLQAVRKRNPLQPLIGITDRIKGISEWKKWGIQHLAIDYTLLTSEIVEDLVTKGITVWAFTVDVPGVARTLIEWGVEGIITNSPQIYVG